MLVCKDITNGRFGQHRSLKPPIGYDLYRQASQFHIYFRFLIVKALFATLVGDFSEPFVSRIAVDSSSGDTEPLSRHIHLLHTNNASISHTQQGHVGTGKNRRNFVMSPPSLLLAIKK